MQKCRDRGVNTDCNCWFKISAFSFVSVHSCPCLLSGGITCWSVLDFLGTVTVFYCSLGQVMQFFFCVQSQLFV